LPTDGKPTVLFLCVHNAGRSQMALGFFQHLAGDRAVAWSGGSEPGSEVNPAAIEAMAERGIDISAEFPKPWTEEIVRAADVVITMGCGDACPVIPGKRQPVPPACCWPCSCSENAGGHFNPVVSLVDAALGGMPWLRHSPTCPPRPSAASPEPC
jgi:Low molecular weight phosphotyrosine protein phosphatase